MLEGRVITNTLKEIKRNSNYPYKEQLLNCDLSGLKELIKDDKLVAYCLYRLWFI